MATQVTEIPEVVEVMVDPKHLVIITREAHSSRERVRI
jgi:hypothetical protein